ncbi:hypothetical protein K9M41_01880 [Candidatus Gracilibacteria bacterium]|nr:hypothetical protein [Candidatus Gracilibacteria bacterium]
MKRKNSGVSLIVVLGISFAVLGVAMATLSSVSKGLEQGTAIERSNQIFFATESGIEAALFHHNARGQGVHFPDDVEIAGEFPQRISLPASSATVAWEIAGRDETIDTLLKENQPIQIPFFWDNSTNPTEAPPLDMNGNFDPTHDNAGELNLNAGFSLTFNTSNAKIPRPFDFGNADNEVLLDWSVSRKLDDGGFETFLPDKGAGGVCDPASAFICEDEFLVGDEFAFDVPANINGKISPGLTDITLAGFLDYDIASLFKLSFRPLLSFSHEGDPETEDDDANIPGIPFVFDPAENAEVPLPYYTITSAVSIGDFSRTISVEIAEKTGIGGFDYVIFD